MSDILSLFVSNEAALSFIKKTFRVYFILLIGNITYALFALMEWYKYIQLMPAQSSDVPHYFYNYIVWPSITLLDVLIVVTGSAFNYRSYSFLVSAVKKEDDTLLAMAFKKFYITSCLFLLSTLLLLIDETYRTFFVS
jgi:hypothetical protein